MNIEFVKGLIRSVGYFPQRLLFTIKEKATHIDSNGKLAIVIIVKNEDQYIEEWIRYHELVGIDHIFIYDNDSTDETEKLVHPYETKGFVTLIHFPGQGVQLDAYDDAIMRFRDKYEYMAFIDADEFLYSMDDNKNVKQQVVEMFNMYPEAAGLAINWRMFGSSGLKKKPPKGGVLENFLYCSKVDGKGNECIKTIVRPNKVFKYVHCHYPMYLINGFSVDENGHKVKYWSNKNYCVSRLRINHYFTKSEEEWIIRRGRPKADFKDTSNLRTMEEFYEHDNNDVYDDGMLRFVNEMK